MKPFRPGRSQSLNLAALKEIRQRKRVGRPGDPYKKIRAAHAKEKQQIQKTCNRPNRLNLLIWTLQGGWRSNYLRFSYVL
jgi:hypothetical protein